METLRYVVLVNGPLVVFRGQTLHQPLGMMNGQRSGLLASWRYVL
ncbi:hypothetical protein [Spirosoma endophyticum]|uniref:Uncharacterized protein n=1 Tax=Spirosoma endophyticum TaxID=662367 RepID=A0A1I1Q687_9BACT|nr:hypothetical protein [Spirosoma endophyticum]SFD14733.1 hypothetical protein SAMN05216167_103504 [Spirosoma endophyticum]